MDTFAPFQRFGAANLEQILDDSCYVPPRYSMKTATILALGLLSLASVAACASDSGDDSESSGGSAGSGGKGSGSGGTSGGSGGTAGSGTGGSGGTATGGTAGTGTGGSGGAASTGGSGGSSGGTGGSAGSGGTGGEPGEATASETCKTYCTCMKDNCGETAIPGSVSCYEFCATFESNEEVMGCRQNMCNLAPAQPANGHCTHAVGDGQCTL
jgi:hypothetical protein